ncbi:MAG: VOC family protein, partial [Elusimicrobia bacterium]|nr:VOC family protein [Elusimicrobiota bacterium]
MKPITPCLWFEGQAEQAARFYTSIFKKSKITLISHYDDFVAKQAGMKAGSVLCVAFRLKGQEMLALNGGPQFK